jgi:hypothetical protein
MESPNPNFAVRSESPNDSRQYRFAYLIQSLHDFPEDFPPLGEHTLFPALFLPRGGADWFGRSANPPRVILCTSAGLEVHFHPESGRPPVSFPCNEYLSIQTGRMLLIGWIRFASKEADLKLLYNRRVDEPVRIFLGMLRARFLRPDAILRADQAFLGDAPDLKFQNALNHEIDEGEVERVRLFVAPRMHPSGCWPFRIRRSTPGHLIVLTDRRLLWITESYRHTRALYGSVTCYAHPGNVARVEAVSRLSISLRNGKTWTLDIPEEMRRDACEFAAMAEARMMTRATERP